MGSKVVFNSVMGTDFGLEVMKEWSEKAGNFTPFVHNNVQHRRYVLPFCVLQIKNYAVTNIFQLNIKNTLVRGAGANPSSSSCLIIPSQLRTICLKSKKLTYIQKGDPYE